MNIRAAISVIMVLGIVLLLALSVPTLGVYQLVSSGDFHNTHYSFYIENENGINADYVEAAITPGYDEYLPFSAIQEAEVLKLVEYMRENHLNIAEGSYWIGQHFTFERMLTYFEFIEESESL